MAPFSGICNIPFLYGIAKLRDSICRDKKSVKSVFIFNNVITIYEETIFCRNGKPFVDDLRKIQFNNSRQIKVKNCDFWDSLNNTK